MIDPQNRGEMCSGSLARRHPWACGPLFRLHPVLCIQSTRRRKPSREVRMGDHWTPWQPLTLDMLYQAAHPARMELVQNRPCTHIKNTRLDRGASKYALYNYPLVSVFISLLEMLLYNSSTRPEPMSPKKARLKKEALQFQTHQHPSRIIPLPPT